MDDEDAEYMQGSDDEVRALSQFPGAHSPLKSRITGLTTQMEKVPTMLWVQMSRTCTTPPNVCNRHFFSVAPLIQESQQRKKSLLNKH